MSNQNHSEDADSSLFLVEIIKGQLALGRTLDDTRRFLRTRFPETDLDKAFDVFTDYQRHIVGSSKIHTLSSNAACEGWFSGPSMQQDSHWSLLKSHLRHKIPAWTDEMVTALDIESTGVVAQLAPPFSEAPIRVNGLVMGYIQSGKTANFSAVIAKAVDAGYRLIIVLAGMYNNLRLQTQVRLHEELVKPKQAACTTLTMVDEKGDFMKKQAVTANRALGTRDGFTLVVIKKNTHVLRNFLGWLHEGDPVIVSKCPTLIIDDESDQASINTNRPEENPTAINDKVRQLCNSSDILSYIGYTATPFANVLVDSSVDDDLFPKNFIACLNKPPTYFGPEELFGRDAINDVAALDGIPVIRNVPANEWELLRHRRTAPMPTHSFLVPSLREAIDSFILGAAGRLTRNHWRQHITMLVHTSHAISLHEKLKKELEEYLLEYRFKFAENDPDTRRQLESLWTNDFLAVSKHFPGLETPPFDTIWKNATKFVSRLELVLENSASEERLSFSGAEPVWAIVVGGNTLSRGLTIEGLTTSYFVRSTTTYDTALQMGRWFGYRPGYVDLTRIFVPEVIKNHFYHLATVEEEVREEITTMAVNKERPIDVGLRIRKHPNMAVTSTLKMRTARDCFLTYSATKLQARHLTVGCDDILVANHDAISQLLNDSNRQGVQTGASAFREFEKCLLFRNIPTELILQFIDRFHFSSGNIKFSRNSLIDYISGVNQAGELSDWSLAIMGARSGRSVTVGPYNACAVDRSAIKESYSNADGGSIQLRALTTPGDELIDLGDVIRPAATSVEQILYPKDGEPVSEVFLRNKYRPVERALMLIYPLNWNPDMTDDEFNQRRAEPSITEPLRAKHPVFGVAFVFPKTNHSASQFKYVINNTI